MMPAMVVTGVYFAAANADPERAVSLALQCPALPLMTSHSADDEEPQIHIAFR
jgi:hypothetical protein